MFLRSRMRDMQFARHIAKLAAHACTELDLRQHRATHPRLGTVDHISWHPLGTGAATLAGAAEMATSAAAMLSQLVPDLPIHLYGAASSTGARLRDVRRDCGVLADCANLRCSLAPTLRLAAGITSLASFAAAIIRRSHGNCGRKGVYV